METTTHVQEEEVIGRPGSAAKLIREVRAKTCRKFLAEDKIRIVLEGFRKEMPAQKQWRHKTTRPDKLWQCDATNLFVVGWGYYKLIAVEDDFSRKIIAHDVRPDETAFSLSDILEMGLENAKNEGHLTGNDSMPKLYSDNGSGFASEGSCRCWYNNTAMISHYGKMLFNTTCPWLKEVKPETV